MVPRTRFWMDLDDSKTAGVPRTFDEQVDDRITLSKDFKDDFKKTLKICKDCEEAPLLDCRSCGGDEASGGGVSRGVMI